jgi:hypothetical protein
MPIQIQAPNGELVEFPDGTADDVMSKAMQETYGTPAPTAPTAAPAQTAQAPDPWQRSLLVPAAKNRETGEVAPALPRIITGIPDAVRGIPDAVMGLPGALMGAAKGVAEGVGDAVTAPGRAMKGELQVMGPDGNVTPEAIGEGLNFAGLAAGVAPGLRAGESIVGGRGAFRDVKVNPPTAQELKAASADGYETLRGLDAQYSSQAVSDIAAKVQRTLEQQGINEKVAPKTFANLRELQNPPEGSFASSSNLETIRRTFGEIGQDFANPSDRNAGKFARGAIDEFLSRPPDGAVLAGSEEAAAQAGRIASDARGNYAASKRSSQLDGLVTAAEDRAGATNSGQNIGNSIRQRAASILSSPKLSSGFTENELGAIRAVARGTIGQNLTRYVGNLLGGGGGLGAAVTGGLGAAPGVAAGSPMMTAAGVALPAVGAAAKTVSNVMTEKALAAVNKSTRMRSPLYEEMQRSAGREAVAPTREASFLRMLMLGSQGGNQ